MKSILIFRHVAHEGAGYFAEVLDKHRIPYHWVYIDQNEPVPKRLGPIGGLVFMGGPMSVNDPLPWIQDELALIRTAVRDNIPVLGHCLGGQLISKALGGRVTKNAITEIGWFDVEQVPHAENNAWMKGVPKNFPVFHWHGETFSIPPGAIHLLQNANCMHQAFAIGPTLALQCHVEMTEDLVQLWLRSSTAELQQKSPAVQSLDEITRDLPGRIKALQKIADVLYERWLQPVQATIGREAK